MTPPEAPLILCCEDEPQLLRDISDELREAGYRVMATQNGRELLACLEEVTPDLLLCDIMMPDVDGYDVLVRLRRDYPKLAHVPLIFLSALSMTDAMIRGKRAGADDYLTKPIHYDLLLSTIEARLRQSRQARQNVVTVAGIGQHICDGLTVGLMTFSPDGQQIQANAIARKILERDREAIVGTLAEPVRRMGQHARDGVESSHSVLVSDLPLCMAQIHACPENRQAGIPAAVIVFLTEPALRAPMSSEALMSLFGLTATETHVARHLASGMRPDEISEALGVAPTTTAFHLRNIFSKTGTRRQAELVALLLSFPVQDHR